MSDRTQTHAQHIMREGNTIGGREQATEDLVYNQTGGRRVRGGKMDGYEGQGEVGSGGERKREKMRGTRRGD